MKTYKEMLEAEMDASSNFSRANFGLKVGDEFPELVREIVKSDKASGLLIMSMLMSSFGGKDFATDLKELKMNIGEAVLKHVDIFQTPLAFLYWGIQIGRKMERVQSATETSTET